MAGPTRALVAVMAHQRAGRQELQEAQNVPWFGLRGMLCGPRPQAAR